MYAKDKQTIIDRREMLRIKVNSLTAEARMIRRAEQKAWGELRTELHAHRVIVVRRTARSAHLALGFIKGRALSQMEHMPYTPPNWKEIRTLLRRYGAKGMLMPVEMPDAYKVGSIIGPAYSFAAGANVNLLAAASQSVPAAWAVPPQQTNP